MQWISAGHFVGESAVKVRSISVASQAQVDHLNPSQRLQASNSLIFSWKAQVSWHKFMKIVAYKVIQFIK